MRCRCCGGAVVEMLETLPYVGPGPCVVEVRDIHVARCTGCTKMTIEVPESQALDTLIRCLGNEMSGLLPQLTYEQGRWCILPLPGILICETPQ
jgi:hypothetical protein